MTPWKQKMSHLLLNTSNLRINIYILQIDQRIFKCNSRNWPIIKMIKFNMDRLPLLYNCFESTASTVQLLWIHCLYCTIALNRLPLLNSEHWPLSKGPLIAALYNVHCTVQYTVPLYIPVLFFLAFYFLHILVYPPPLTFTFNLPFSFTFDFPIPSHVIYLYHIQIVYPFPDLFSSYVIYPFHSYLFYIFPSN